MDLLRGRNNPSELRAKTEELEAFKRQNDSLKQVLKENEKRFAGQKAKHAAELETLRKELTNWKKQAFSAVLLDNKTGAVDIYSMPEYQQLFATSQEQKQTIAKLRQQLDQAPKGNQSERKDAVPAAKEKPNDNVIMNKVAEQFESTVAKLEALQQQFAAEKAKLSSENDKLKVEKTELGEDLYAEQKKTEELKQSVEKLKKEVFTLDMSNADLRANKEELEDKYAASKEVIGNLARQIERLQQANDEKAEEEAVDTTSTQTRGRTSSRLHAKYGLPKDELIVTSFTCWKGVVLSYLHITSNYICFDAAIKLKDILSINKIDKTLLLGGTFKQSAELVLRSGQTLVFYGFLKRKDCVRTIYEKAQELGHKIIILRNGLRDDRSGTPSTD